MWFNGVMKRFEFSILPINQILPNPRRVRYHISQKGLLELADSIREYGLLQPLIVGRTPAGLQLIAGERRYRAAKIAGLTEVPAMVGDAASIDLLLIYLEENYRRIPLTLLEQAKLVQNLKDNHSISGEIVARRLDVTEEYLQSLENLLKLPLIIHDAYLKGELTDQQLLQLTKEADPLHAFYQTKS